MDIVFFGIQGSGKGTQAKLLVQDYDYYVFEAGNELRKIASSNSALGQEISSYIDNGSLVPFTIIITVMKKAIESIPLNQSILFDGIPRDMDQMNCFIEIMKDLGRSFYCIHFLLSKEQALLRITKRAQLENRIDDLGSAKIERRLAWFYEKNMPVIDYLSSQGLVSTINAEQDKDMLYTELIQLITSHNE